jgi:AcrR family transcriptional regulator
VENVKPSPQLTLRAERAMLTRRRIAEAARHLFFQDGYAATTLQGVATEAGVAVQTVYAVYGSKVGILRALRDLAVNQPEAGAAFAEAMRAATLGGSLDHFGHSIRMRWEFAGDIVRILGDARMADVTIREEVEVALRTRRSGVTAFATTLGERFELGIEPKRAAAILLALTLPELHSEFIDTHGWTEDEYETWLTASMRWELIGV